MSLRLTLGPLLRGTGDPAMRIDASGVWRASRTPEGPATLHLWRRGDRIGARAWGQGAAWAIEHAPALAGGTDDRTGFSAHHDLVAELDRRYPGVAFARSEAVLEALVPTILEQKVVAQEARYAYRRLLRALGEPAPGPLPLVVPPEPARIAGTPSYTFHRWGVERKRADTVRRAARCAARLEETPALPRTEAYARLEALPGVGPWTAAEVGALAFGDADAVSVGDFHLKHLVCFALAGEIRGTDERMLELLEPYRPHRGRVVRLLEIGADRPPAFGPRMPLQRIAAL